MFEINLPEDDTKDAQIIKEKVTVAVSKGMGLKWYPKDYPFTVSCVTEKKKRYLLAYYFKTKEQAIVYKSDFPKDLTQLVLNPMNMTLQSTKYSEHLT